MCRATSSTQPQGGNSSHVPRHLIHTASVGQQLPCAALPHPHSLRGATAPMCHASSCVWCVRTHIHTCSMHAHANVHVCMRVCMHVCCRHGAFSNTSSAEEVSKSVAHTKARAAATAAVQA
eukprot:352672-Chlamydomonas_euryale.AAC.17